MKRGTTSKPVPSGAQAVMASRREPPESLDFFPTPPYATRALVEHLGPAIMGASVWEPAAGEGHMAEVLRETCSPVFASDIFDYNKGYAVGSFISGGFDFGDEVSCPFIPDWIITNPPFNLSAPFARRAIGMARVGVALFVRSAWLETVDRYNTLFVPHPPSEVALFVERVALIKGRWDPDASTATSYCWVIWERRHRGETRLSWIPPGRKESLTSSDDARRFAPETASGDLFDEAAAS